MATNKELQQQVRDLQDELDQKNAAEEAILDALGIELTDDEQDPDDQDDAADEEDDSDLD